MSYNSQTNHHLKFCQESKITLIAFYTVYLYLMIMDNISDDIFSKCFSISPSFGKMPSWPSVYIACLKNVNALSPCNTYIIINAQKSFKSSWFYHLEREWASQFVQQNSLYNPRLGTHAALVILQMGSQKPWYFLKGARLFFQGTGHFGKGIEGDTFLQHAFIPSGTS